MHSASSLGACGVPTFSTSPRRPIRGGPLPLIGLANPQPAEMQPKSRDSGVRFIDIGDRGFTTVNWTSRSGLPATTGAGISTSSVSAASQASPEAVQAVNVQRPRLWPLARTMTSSVGCPRWGRLMKAPQKFPMSTVSFHLTSSAGRRRDEWPTELARRESRLAAIRAAKAALEAEARANAARDAAVAQDKVATREQREGSAL